MVIIRRRKKSVAELKLWHKTCSSRSVLGTLLEDYGMGAKAFVWDGQLYTVERALKDVPDYLLDMRCDDFGVIRFFGGPPGNPGWYEGTLLTMLCDAILFEAYSFDMPLEKRMGC